MMLQTKELNSSNVPQRINALLFLKEQRNFAFKNLKRRQKMVKTYFNKKENDFELKIDDGAGASSVKHTWRDNSAP
jgi:hypothetical protein